MSGLDEKAVLAACEAYHADIPTHDPPSRWAMEQAISAYLAAATPADVGEEPVARYRKLERELSNTKNTDLRADIKDDIIGLSAELATALERVTRERDEARATLDEVCLSSRQEWQRATSAEAKLAEARKVIEPFARFQTDASGNTDDPLRQPDTQAVVRSSRSGRSVTFGDFRAARRFLEETK